MSILPTLDCLHKPFVLISGHEKKIVLESHNSFANTFYMKKTFMVKNEKSVAERALIFTRSILTFNN
jgi:hypothetical protein